MPILDERPSEKWFCDLMKHAALAGSCNYWSRREPAAARGLNRIASRERALAGAALNEFLEGGANMAEPPSPLVHAPTGGPVVGGATN